MAFLVRPAPTSKIGLLEGQAKRGRHHTLRTIREKVSRMRGSMTARMRLIVAESNRSKVRVYLQPVVEEKAGARIGNGEGAAVTAPHDRADRF